MMADESFWSRQRVLLTGHTGFKGAWLWLWLERLGAQTFGISLEAHTDPSLFKLIGSDKDHRSKILDLRDRTALKKAVKDANPTIVIHMAAQALVRHSFRMPAETFETNVMGTVNLLEALRDCSALGAVLVITTDKVYRNLEDGRAFRESDPLGAHDPYSASKAAAEIVTSSWAQSFFKEARIPIVSARAGNVIGGGDWAQDRLVPDIWRAIQSNAQLVLRNPQATRPWQHVLEPLAGYLSYVEKLAKGNHSLPPSLNFGPYPNDVLTVAQLTEAMLAAHGPSTNWIQDKEPNPPEMKTLSLDSALAGTSLGWRPRLSSQSTITWTADWYSRFAHGISARQLCLEQISSYEKLL